LALVSAIEYSHRSSAEVSLELRQTAERLLTAFPTISIEQIDRYFAMSEEAVA
jgi:hypothetical protein